MKYLRQLLIILAISFAGEILHEALPLPVPAAIYGVALLFFALEFGIVKLSSVKETADFLTEILPLMFIPPAVGLIEVADLLYPKWLAYFLTAFLSTFAVMFVSGRVTQYIAHNFSKEKQGNDRL